MKNILFRWSFFTTLFFISTNLVFAGCSTENKSFNGFSSKTTTCPGEKANTVYYLGNLEITSGNYVEQIKLYKEKYATCPATSHDKMQKTKESRILAKVCIQGEQPSKYLIDSKEVTFQEYVLAFFADFFSFYPNKANQINSNQIKAESQQTNGSKCINLTKSLSKGSENSEVLKLQQFLFSSGYLTVKPNGYFGAGTVTAVKKFQIANGMSPVGSVGVRTRTKVKEVSCGNLESKANTSIVSSVVLPTTKVTSLEFIEIGRSKDPLTSSIDPKVIDGKLLYTTEITKPGWQENKYYFDGKEVGLGKGYDAIGSPFELSGKISYKATKDGKNITVYEGGEYLYGVQNPLAQIDGKVVSTLIKDGKYYLSYEGKESLTENYIIFEALNINSKLAYLAMKKDLKDKPAYLVFYDNKKIGEYFKIDQPDLKSSLYNVNGKLAFVAQNEDHKSYIIYDGVEIGKEYDTANYPREINGKLTYIARKDKKYFIVYDGKEIGKDQGYDSIGKISSIGGKLAYKVTKGTENFIVYDGKEIAKGNDYVTDPIDVNGKLAYEFKKGSSYFINYDGAEVGKQYMRARSPFSINGKLGFVATVSPAKGTYQNFIVLQK